jgi:hypothetical protein
MKNGNRPSWLILSHGFNMDGRAASQTITDKIPHLINAGINPIVLSAITGRKDEQIEHHQILPAFPVALRFDLRHYLKQRIRSRYAYRMLMLVVTTILIPFMLLEKLFVRIETHWSWAITAFLYGARIIKRSRPTVIYSTGGAYSAHLAGYWLSRRFQLPWIAEIHDPMVYPGLTKSRMRMRFSLWLEGIICKNAALVWWKKPWRVPEHGILNLAKRAFVLFPAPTLPNSVGFPTLEASIWYLDILDHWRKRET